MTRRSRRNHSPAFKSKVALAAVRGEQTLGKLAQHFDVHANQIKQWRDQLLKGASDVFDPGIKPTPSTPRVDVKTLHAKIGELTLECMQSGIYWGYISMVEGLIMRIRKEYGENLKTVATGGLAPLFANGTNMIDHIDQDLTLIGLVEIYRRNRPF